MKQFYSFIESSLGSLYKIAIAHCQTIKFGVIADTYTANNIVSAYARCKELGYALKLFDDIPHRDTVSWNTMIAGYVNCGRIYCAFEFVKDMKTCRFGLDEYTFGSILKGAACNEWLLLGQQMHSDVLKMGYEGNVYAASALLDMYSKCGRVEDALVVFQHMPERNSVSWNALIAGYAELGDRNRCFWLFICMGREGVKLDDGSFAPLLTLLNNPKFYRSTTQLHAKIVKHGLASDTTSCNAIIAAYSECGSIKDAKGVFECAVDSGDLVTWNSMLAAYLEHNQGELAFKLFLDMQRAGFEPDIYTYTSVISASFEEAYQWQGKSLHALVVKKGVEELTPISNSLIAMYLRSNGKYMDDAMRIFEYMDVKDRVSWNSILTGFSQNGLSENALQLFGKMRFGCAEIDHYTFSAILRSCSDLATLRLGQQLHALALKSGFESNEYVASSLIFMYSKCGILEDARRSFESTAQDSPIIWNSIIFGYAQHGQGKAALDLFWLMRDRKVKLDHISFVAVLTACSHIGYVGEGYKFLKSMETDFGITPRMEHYACAIDLLGRAGRLAEAKALINDMPFEPDAMVWKTLLGACRICGDIEYAAEVANHLLEIEPREHCTYILLSSMYGRLKRWDDIANVKKLMKERGVKKVPGWSWIEVKNEVHAFNALDHSHPLCQKIYEVLGKLMEEIASVIEDADIFVQPALIDAHIYQVKLPSQEAAV